MKRLLATIGTLGIIVGAANPALACDKKKKSDSTERDETEKESNEG